MSSVQSLYDLKSWVCFFFVHTCELVCVMQKQLVSITSLACDYLPQKGELATLVVKSEWADPPAVYPDDGSLQIREMTIQKAQVYQTSIYVALSF